MMMYNQNVKGCVGLAYNVRDEDSTKLFHKTLFFQFYKTLLESSSTICMENTYVLTLSKCSGTRILRYNFSVNFM